jgi:hypothetical protein
LPKRWVVERSMCATRRSVCIPGLDGVLCGEAGYLCSTWVRESGVGLFRMGCGRLRSLSSRRRKCGRRVVEHRTRLMRRCSRRSSTCWSAAVPGGPYRRASGCRSRRCTAVS